MSVRFLPSSPGGQSRSSPAPRACNTERLATGTTLLSDMGVGGWGWGFQFLPLRLGAHLKLLWEAGCPK